MRHSKASIIVSAGLAGILAFGICGCSASSSSESSSTISTEVTDEDGNTTTTETTSTTKDGETETTTTTNKTLEIGDWEDAWMGETSNGHTVLYAQSPDGGAQGMMVIYNPADETLESFVGENTNIENEDGHYVKTTDAGNGSTMTVEILSQDEENNIKLNLGDEYGTVEIKPVSMDELIAELTKIDVNGQVIK